VRIILLFLDGVGIGKKDPNTNPFFSAYLPSLTSILGGTLPHTTKKRISAPQAELVAVNATLGVAGLPQSGTGQTAIFTGVNGAKVFGRHFGPHPPTVLRPIIEEHNIFRKLKTRGKSVCFANAFPQRFFEYANSGSRRLTVTTLSCMMAGVHIRTAEDLNHNEGISPDFTRTRWPELGHPNIHPVTPKEAGHHLWHIAQNFEFTLFDYWLTDHAGHSQKMRSATDALEKLDLFLEGVLELFDHHNSLLIIISDHGNLEDLSVKTHTRNPVPCIAVGRHRKEFASSIRNLTHVSPAIIDLLTKS
jgi:2,3-bisphosphoglycerate-independent phosphoglycerate mutase